jgi:hypothetical protein
VALRIFVLFRLMHVACLLFKYSSGKSRQNSMGIILLMSSSFTPFISSIYPFVSFLYFFVKTMDYVITPFFKTPFGIPMPSSLDYRLNIIPPIYV